MTFSVISTPEELKDLLKSFEKREINTVAMDFEEESNLHVYGEHLCTIQLFDRENFFLIDALSLQKSEEGKALLKDFLEGAVEKIMFDCSSDAAIVRKVLGIHMKNVYDVRVVAKALGFAGNLTGLVERNLGIPSEGTASKHKYQRANWMRRPLPQAQIQYALDDVKYLFDLKASLEDELESQSPQLKAQVRSEMKKCAQPKHRDKPGWEKICNYKNLSLKEKVFIKYFFMARDEIARKLNVPAANVLDKRLIVEMAKLGEWQSVVPKEFKYTREFENAKKEAEQRILELQNKG
ncbi:MAG: 3'-5' exonuclease [Sphaerochaetaceae bacterium]|nr:3'-5' exonuclease [Sphaerochaetaceae bacterium]